MLTPDQREILSHELVPLFQQLEQDVIHDIARRVVKESRWTETAELQVKALQDLGYAPNEIQRKVLAELRADRAFKDYIAKNTLEYKRGVKSKIDALVEEAKQQGNQLVANAGNMSFEDDMMRWAMSEKKPAMVGALANINKSTMNQLMGEIRNITRSMGFKDTGTPIAVERAFNDTLDSVMINISSGAFSKGQAIENAVRKLERSGLRKVDFKNGVSRNIDTAIMLATNTALGQMTASISMANAELLGTDMVEVDAHAGARPGHAAWQGKVYSISGRDYPELSAQLGYKIRGLEEATGYPSDPTGLCGYNCRHTFYPFVVGASEPTKWDIKEPESFEYNGRGYDYYQATQKQRQIEREIRTLKRRHLGGENMTAAITAKEQQYARFCKAGNLKQKINRLYVKGYKRDFEYIQLEEMPKNGKIKLINTSNISNRSVIHLGKREDLTAFDLTKVAPAQDKHIVDTNSYNHLKNTRDYPPSYLTISKDEVSRIVQDYAGKGLNLYNRKGGWTKAELILTNEKPIGFVVNNLNGEQQETTVFKIHYSKKGVHIVPDYMKKKGRYKP